MTALVELFCPFFGGSCLCRQQTGSAAFRRAGLAHGLAAAGHSALGRCKVAFRPAGRFFLFGMCLAGSKWHRKGKGDLQGLKKALGGEA